MLLHEDPTSEWIDWPLLFSHLISGQINTCSMLNDDSFCLFTLFFFPFLLCVWRLFVFTLTPPLFPPRTLTGCSLFSSTKHTRNLLAWWHAANAVFHLKVKCQLEKGEKRTASTASFYLFCAWSGNRLNLLGLYCDSEWRWSGVMESLGREWVEMWKAFS